MSIINLNIAEPDIKLIIKCLKGYSVMNEDKVSDALAEALKEYIILEGVEEGNVEAEPYSPVEKVLEEERIKLKSPDAPIFNPANFNFNTKLVKNDGHGIKINDYVQTALKSNGKNTTWSIFKWITRIKKYPDGICHYEIDNRWFERNQLRTKKQEGDEYRAKQFDSLIKKNSYVHSRKSLIEYSVSRN